MKRYPFALSLAALLLAALACQTPALPGLDSKSGPTATAAPPPVDAPAGWIPVYGEGVSLFVPPGWAGGNPRTEAATLAGYLRAYGVAYEGDALAVEAQAGGGLLWAYDANAPQPGALTTIHVAAFTLPGVALADHLQRAIANTAPGEQVEGTLTGTINGWETGRVESSLTSATPPRRALLYIFKVGDTFYHLTYSAPADVFGTTLETFEASARTFRTGTLPGPNPAPSILPTATAETPVITPGGLTFNDEFNNPDSGWDQLNTEFGQYTYNEGEYQFLIYQSGALLWSVRPEVTADITLEVDARFAAPAGLGETGLVGLVCGYQDNDNFFYAAVSNSGYYGLFQVTPAGETFVGMDDWQPSLKLNLGEGVNRLRLDCVQGVMQFWINGELTAAAAAPSALDGQFGLVAGSFNWAGAYSAFDDFSVRPYAP
ncbi:MAG: hypothetical protein EPO32_02205 [Anaerolineae bacterium]|nr:MAG: hypothetical protein EPO32_02205 [Anaerolineae bacterium]